MMRKAQNIGATRGIVSSTARLDQRGRTSSIDVT